MYKNFTAKLQCESFIASFFLKLFVFEQASWLFNLTNPWPILTSELKELFKFYFIFILFLVYFIKTAKVELLCTKPFLTGTNVNKKGLIMSIFFLIVNFNSKGPTAAISADSRPRLLEWPCTIWTNIWRELHRTLS